VAPPSVQHDMNDYIAKTRREGMRFGLWGLATWCAAIPAAFSLGIVHLGAAVLAALSVVFFTLGLAWMFFAKRPTLRHTVAVGVGSVIAVASLSAWLGPFVLLPAAATVVFTVMAVTCEPRERVVLLLIGALTTTLPFALEYFHVVPASVLFENGHIVIRERVFALRPGPTLLALLYTNVSFTLVPQLLVGRIRDQLVALQQRFVTQAWHLRQIVDEPTPDTEPGNPSS
jgi:eukaryotic-like serine/threonine-protein kinase